MHQRLGFLTPLLFPAKQKAQTGCSLVTFSMVTMSSGLWRCKSRAMPWVRISLVEAARLCRAQP